MAVLKSPDTTTITDNGLLIMVSPGIVVGAITQFTVNEGRAATEVFAFGDSVVGGGDDLPSDPSEPYEIVPGNTTGNTIQVVRQDIYTDRFETAFGTANPLVMLTKQDRSIRLIEVMRSPNGDLDVTTVYYGCWFTRKGRSFNAAGNRIVTVNAEVRFARKREL